MRKLSFKDKHPKAGKRHDLRNGVTSDGSGSFSLENGKKQYPKRTLRQGAVVFCEETEKNPAPARSGDAGDEKNIL